MIEIDRMMIDDYKIDLLLMMENAGMKLASLASKILKGYVINKKIIVLIGKGNNGGGGLVAARHLHNWGASVSIILGSNENLRNIPEKQLDIDRKIGININEKKVFTDEDLIIDALIGYNLTGNPREPIAEIIRKANNSEIPILSLDIPSGLDSSTGIPYNPCIVASTTLTLALPKNGLMVKKAKRFVGELYLADISIPREIYQKFGVSSKSFFNGKFIINIQ